MPPQTSLAVLVFSSVMAFTPGPNNVMLASSGARFGLARSLPHLAGVTDRLSGDAAAGGAGPGLDPAGLAPAAAGHEDRQLRLSAVAGLPDRAQLAGDGRCAARQAADLSAGRRVPVDQSQGLADGGGRDLGLHRRPGRAALSPGGDHRPDQPGRDPASTWTWTAFGAGIRRWLRSAAALRLFNLAMALVLVASTVPILVEIKDALSSS